MLINDLRALAVCNGNVVAVPGPSLELLLGISLIGLVGVVRRIWKRKQLIKSR
jgi:hypothetical protein